LTSFNYLKSREHAVAAIKSSAGSNCVNMRTRHHRGADADIPDTDYVSDCIYRYFEIAISHPINKQVAAVHIFVGKCKSTVSSALNRRYFGESVNPRHQTIAINTQFKILITEVSDSH
jgi:hypothetical protein